jgi:UDP-N-acetylglucosamine 2-epimerase (non-hydrolysing)
MDVVLAIGARPGYMKTWGVYQAFQTRGIRPTVVATGQHHDILTQQQNILYMPIHEWLLKEQPRLPLAELYGWIYYHACRFLDERRPDAVFVNGDTTSALAVAMAAFHLQIPIAHIESGRRSGNLHSPYPEEFNRIAIDGMSTYLLAPTERAAQHCHAINPNGKVCVAGNTVIDALKAAIAKIEPDPHGMDAFILLDLHRRETSQAGMEEIVETVIRQAACYGLGVYWPAHPNPKVQEVAQRYRGRTLRVAPPMNYLSFICMMRQAELILTDSGGRWPRRNSDRTRDWPRSSPATHSTLW